jgi:hypothetical protein
MTGHRTHVASVIREAFKLLSDRAHLGRRRLQLHFSIHHLFHSLIRCIDCFSWLARKSEHSACDGSTGIPNCIFNSGCCRSVWGIPPRSLVLTVNSKQVAVAGQCWEYHEEVRFCQWPRPSTAGKPPDHPFRPSGNQVQFCHMLCCAEPEISDYAGISLLTLCGSVHSQQLSDAAYIEAWLDIL